MRANEAINNLKSGCAKMKMKKEKAIWNGWYQYKRNKYYMYVYQGGKLCCFNKKKIKNVEINYLKH